MEYTNLTWLYLRDDGTPRNHMPSELNPDKSLEERLRAELGADVEALKQTQRYVAVGIVAVGTAIASVLNPPSDAVDFLRNMSVPIAVQTLNYVSFRKGIHLMRSRANERRQTEGHSD